MDKKRDDISQDSIGALLKTLDDAANTITAISSKINSKFEDIRASSELYSHVCGIEKLRELEGSVGETIDARHANSHPNIYVRSTLFKLETTDTEFEKMLINNLRKGVRYNYLIPLYSNPDDYDSFYDMVMDWWDYYSLFLVSEEDCKKVYELKASNWDPQYVSCLDRAKSYYELQHKTEKWEELTKEVFALFKDRLRVFTADECTFYSVTALYQVGRYRWKAIVKLPTEQTEPKITGYFSFVVFGNGTADNENPFVKKFKANFKNKFNTEPLYKKIQESFGVRIYAAHKN